MAEPPPNPVIARDTRQCPTTDTVHPPLIAQNIGVGLCFSRQRQLYHKCHRCLYRGRPASFVPTRPEAKKA